MRRFGRLGGLLALVAHLLACSGVIDGAHGGSDPPGSAANEPDIPGSGLVYHAPATGRKVRLVRNPESTATRIILDVVAAAPLTGYAAGMNLPLDAAKVQLDADAPFTPGTALPPGSAPVAAKAVLPTSGPMAGVLVSGQSQKAAGTGAVPNDSTIPEGAVLYTLRLQVRPGAPTGMIFDGAAPGPKFRAGVRDKLGNEVAGAEDFRIGRLMNN